ncbi:MAG: hypothetical protein HFH37_02815 [Lachnospiraceae bacterium]|nr:hypothetical protein [Lachnospiraceae bacterium]
MIWYKEFYAGESIGYKKEKVKWKILHNAGQLDIYVIALSSNPHNLLDIISSIELMQKAYPRQDMMVVGIDKGYDNAVGLAGRIIMDVFQKTGNLNIREYFLEQQKNIRRRSIWKSFC